MRGGIEELLAYGVVGGACAAAGGAASFALSWAVAPTSPASLNQFLLAMTGSVVTGAICAGATGFALAQKERHGVDRWSVLAVVGSGLGWAASLYGAYRS